MSTYGMVSGPAVSNISNCTVAGIISSVENFQCGAVFATTSNATISIVNTNITTALNFALASFYWMDSDNRSTCPWNGQTV